MRLLSIAKSFLRSLFRRQRIDADLDDEIRSAGEMLAEQKVKEGIAPGEARRPARIELGDVEQGKERVREARAAAWFDTPLQDLRFGLRALRKSPGFTAVAVLTLALGIGANTAIFTLIDGILLRTLPVANPSELYRLGNTHQCCNIGGVQEQWSIFSYPLYRQLRDHTPEFGEMAAFAGGLDEFGVRRSGSGAPPTPLVGEYVSGNYFAMLGLGAFAGRLIAPTDDAANAPPVAVISYRSWQEFGGQSSIIGATFVLNTMPFTVIGVAPPSFYGDRTIADPPDVWLPISAEPTLDGPNSMLDRVGSNWLYVVGRLMHGANPAGMQSELTVELRNWLAAQPGLSVHDRIEAAKTRITLSRAAAGIDVVQHENASGLMLLAAVSALVLLIASANVAGLFLVRGTARRRETAVRMALGAPRARLIRQVVTESVLLAAVGGIAGLCFAFALARMILLLAFRGAGYVPISAEPSFMALGFTFLLSLITGVVFGPAPAWVGSRSDPAEALHGRGASEDRGSATRRSLVALQLGACLILLIGAGLLSRSLRNLQNQKFGFRPDGVLLVKVDPSLAGYKPGELYSLYQQLPEQLQRLPGVVSVAWSRYAPMEDFNSEWTIHIEGYPPSEQIFSSFDLVSPNYFRTMRTRLLLGRDINANDTATSQPVAVVNEAFVKQYIRGKNPIGTHFGFADMTGATDYQIVGVVEDAKYYHERDYPMFFLPIVQKVPSAISFLQYVGDIELRTEGNPQNLGTIVRRALVAINPNLSVIKIVSLPEQIAENFNMERLIARLTELYGFLALCLAGVGLYGITAYSVTRRTHEIGVRVALGASGRSIFRSIIGQGLKLGLIGVAVGVAGAIALTRLLASLLYSVSTNDPMTFLGAATVLLGVVLFASYVPARRAMRVDPMVALRHE
jgi:macrolide transport system ATP-binding/permease protein